MKSALQIPMPTPLTRLYPAIHRQFSENAEALGDVSLVAPIIASAQVGNWQTVKQLHNGELQTVRIGGRSYAGYLKPTHHERGFRELAATLLATCLGAPAAPLIAIQEPDAWWLFSAAAFSKTRSRHQQRPRAANAFTQGMAAQFALFINDWDRGSHNQVYANDGAICLFDFETPPSQYPMVHPNLLKWQRQNQPRCLSLQRRAYGTGATLMANRIARIAPFEIMRTIEVAAAILPQREPAVTQRTLDNLLAQQKLLSRGPIRPSLLRDAMTAFDMSRF